MYSPLIDPAIHGDNRRRIPPQNLADGRPVDDPGRRSAVTGQSGTNRDANSRLNVLVEITCPYIRVITIMFAILLVFTLVATASVITLSPPNSSYYVALMVIALDAPLVVILGGIFYLCRQYRTRY